MALTILKSLTFHSSLTLLPLLLCYRSYFVTALTFHSSLTLLPLLLCFLLVLLCKQRQGCAHPPGYNSGAYKTRGARVWCSAGAGLPGPTRSAGGRRAPTRGGHGGAHSALPGGGRGGGGGGAGGALHVGAGS
eukprot:1195411-Prorocentrum_minimum.AAC.7